MNERTQLKQPGYHPIHPGADRGALPVRGDARRPLVQRRPLAGPVRSLVAAPGPLGVQAKLTVGRPGDLYEQEADRVADQVLRMPEAQVQRACPSCAEEETAQTKRLGPTITPLVQRQAEEPEEEEEETAQRQTKAPEEDEEEEVAQRQTKAPEEDEEEEVAQRQTKAPEEDEEEEETVQAKAAGHAPAVSSAVQAQIGAMRGGGQPLPTATRAFFEPRFGCDFGGVRVHSDARAAATARALSARAFTLGRDVVFGAGEYAPGTEGGRRLLAHELTHVVQQQNDRIVEIQRLVEGDITKMSISEDWAKQLTDDKLRQQIKIARKKLLSLKLKKSKAEYNALYTNLKILRTEALSRFTLVGGLPVSTSSKSALTALGFARTELNSGVVEDPVCTNRGKDVDKYTKIKGPAPVFEDGRKTGGTCGLAWCAYFVKWCLDRAGISNGISGAARSVRTWGERKRWYHEITSVRPVSGDIFYMLPDVNTSNHPCDTNPCVNRGPGTGHVGFVLSVSGDTIKTIEGNVHISNANDGILSQERSISDLDGVLRIQPLT